jgi:N-terminal acetyltransferase B complex non-catalytic subunit
VALRRAFPKERKYEFWKTLFSYLIQKDPTIDENQRKLFGTLAYRFISKAAETVPKDKVGLFKFHHRFQSNRLIKTCRISF